MTVRPNYSASGAFIAASNLPSKSETFAWSCAALLPRSTAFSQASVCVPACDLWKIPPTIKATYKCFAVYFFSSLSISFPDSPGFIQALHEFPIISVRA